MDDRVRTRAAAIRAVSRLTVFDEADAARVLVDTRQADEIAARLSEIGVAFERWPVRTLPEGADQDVVLAIYAPEIARLKARGGYRSIDMVAVTPDHPDRAALRARFLSEHTHAEDEVRLFVDGEALFTLHAGGRVWNMLCVAGDLLSVPAGMAHWFDTGPAPRFTVIRMFVNPDGWVAAYTGSPIAERFPRHEPMAA